MPEATLPILKKGIERRLEFIEFRLFWEGRVNRKDISDNFGISEQQASSDIKRYEDEAPGNMSYNRSEKAYLRSDDFEPRFISESSERFLLQHLAVDQEWMKPGDTWFETMPDIDIVLLKRPAIDSSILLKTLDAIRNKSEVEIEYRSISGKPEKARSIAPHAIFHSMGHWYARAWNRGWNDFRDYHLNRVEKVGPAKPSEIGAEFDLEWAHMIDLEIVPNNELPDSVQEALRYQYSMVDGVLKQTVRLSQTFYLIHAYNMEEQSSDLNPHKRRLLLRNLEKVTETKKVVRELAQDALRRHFDA